MSRPLRDRVFFWPAVLGAVSLFGLLTALVGDGWLDVLSWACLGSLTVVLLHGWFDRPRDRDENASQ